MTAHEGADFAAPARAKRLLFDRYVLDLDRGCLLRDESEVALRPKTFAVLKSRSRRDNLPILNCKARAPISSCSPRIFSERLMAPQRAMLWLAACLFMWVSQGTAWSAELKVFASRAIWTVLGESGPEFEKNSGHKLNAIWG
jgi:hypothetical protein